jgi:predicted DNA-binding protein (MmcQ/YjbR family)
MFAVINLAADGHGVISFASTPERFAELVEQEGLKPAPYLARAHWVAAENWNCLRPAEWQTELRNANAVIFAKLPKRTREVLAMPDKQRRSLITARKKSLPASGRTS